MRINLQTPFAEKDQAKALGARWDGAQKTWYVVDVADLTPFLRWLPNGQAAAATSSSAHPTTPSKMGQQPRALGKPAAVTVSSLHLAACNCSVLPWEDCPHSQPSTQEA